MRYQVTAKALLVITKIVIVNSDRTSGAFLFTPTFTTRKLTNVKNNSSMWCHVRSLRMQCAAGGRLPRRGCSIIHRSLDRRSLINSYQRSTPCGAYLFPQQSISPRYAYGSTNGRLFSVVPAASQQDEAVITTKTKAEIELDDDAALYEGLSSRPIEGGTWEPTDPLRWAANLGRRSAEQNAELAKRIHLKPGDEGYYDVSDVQVEGVTIVRTKEEAEIVMGKLMNADPSIMHACDTEVMAIDLKNVGPVGNGYVTCASVYSGPDFDYGLGDGPGTSLWIDNLDDSVGLLQMFKPWFEDERFLKVWHNYGFDRHVMWNEGIDCLGFGGDTMHMARLQDTGRAKYGSGRGYSLEALTDELIDRRKKPMKEIFGVPRLRKDGTAGLLLDLPAIEDMQRKPEFRSDWINYSAFDAKGTWLIREKLQELLEKMPWKHGENLYYYYFKYLREFGEVLTDMERRGVRVDAHDYLARVEEQARKDREYHVATFRKWAASQIGPDGLAINPASSLQLNIFLFGGAINKKTNEPTDRQRTIQVPREEITPEAILAMEDRDLKKNDASDTVDEETPDSFDMMTAEQLKTMCRGHGLKVSGKKSELKERLRGKILAEEGTDESIDDFETMSVEDLRDACTVRGLSDRGNKNALLKRIREDSAYANELISANCPRDRDAYKRISEALAEAVRKDESGEYAKIMEAVKDKETAESKYVDVTITSIRMDPGKYTVGGAPSVTADVLRGLAGDPFGDDPKYGSAYKHFCGGKAGHDACVGLYSLTCVGSIDTMISNFLTSLQSLTDQDSRVHCSLNLNTETGRLSSRRPNLQNQPALEKDKYKIRQAFQSSPGNNLIVADYGQLELRLLASMTGCQSMIEAFKQGGDFHSRTAMGMFDYIQKKVDDGEILFEWDYSKGDPPKPMLKDEYASERRKAKTLNFSIAYGKTAHGLSQDWGVTKDEAEKMLRAWYDSRPEVEGWQKKVKALAKKKGFTRTLMNRYRQLPEAMGKDRKLIGHAERASINTPIQGGAADVAMMAMIKINSSEILKRLGWVLLLQIHDEVILEGPEETAEEAFTEVISCMEAPWVFGLEETLVPLLVDGSYTHKNWYEAK